MGSGGGGGGGGVVEFVGKKFVGNGADSKLFHSGTGSGFLGVAVPCGTGSKLFYLLLQETKEIFIPDLSRKISIVHDSDPGSGCGTMRIRIQTMLFGCFYSDLLQKNS